MPPNAIFVEIGYTVAEVSHFKNILVKSENYLADRA